MEKSGRKASTIGADAWCTRRSKDDARSWSGARLHQSTRTHQRVVLLVVMYLFLLLFAGLSTWPWLPRTALGWAVFAVVAPPLYRAVEWAGDRLSGPWWENAAVGKALKLLLFIVAGVLFAVVLAVIVVSAR